MRFHLLGLAHTKLHRDYCHCAYSMKAYNLAKILLKQGHEVIAYAPEGSDVPCTEFVPVVSNDLFNKVYGNDDTDNKFFKFDSNDPGWTEMNNQCIKEINERVSEANKEFLLCSFGVGHKRIADNTKTIAVEPGIGYRGIFARFKVFETSAWMHLLYGMMLANPKNYDAQAKDKWADVVIPNYYDPEWLTYKSEKKDYFLYLGRLIRTKGVELAVETARQAKVPLLIAGQGSLDSNEFKKSKLLGDLSHVKELGVVKYKEKAELIANAKAVLVPTFYIEPFGGVNVEAQMSGTPVITSGYGGFTETVLQGVTGYRCMTVEEFVWAAKNIGDIDPAVCREYAMNNFSLDAVAPRYEEYWDRVCQIIKGWYHIRPSVLKTKTLQERLEVAMMGYSDVHEKALEAERGFWGNCANTYNEESKHYIYAELMDIKLRDGSLTFFNGNGKSILDIGGGPVSMLLKTVNKTKAKVIDPMQLPRWCVERYREAGIDYEQLPGEEINESGWEEVWIYNVLQHVRDPEELVRRARLAGKTIRIFDWLEIPSDKAHPHILHKCELDDWFDGIGETKEIDNPLCYKGTCYYGVFHGN